VADTPENSQIGSSPATGYTAPAAPPFQPVTPPPFQPTNTGYQSTAVPPQGAAIPPQGAPAQVRTGGGSTLKIILIILGVLVVLVMMVVGIVGYGVWRVSRAVHVDHKTGETTINTPGGAITSGTSAKLTADDLGTDIYPGARPGHGGARLSLPTGPMVAANYTTSDSKDKVIAFYKEKFGSQATVMDTDDGALLTVNKSKQDTVMMTITQKPSQNDGKTQIHIVHTINHSAQ
jgi:hypothetical protein